MDANPGTLNQYLRTNNGYLCAGGDCNNLVLDAPDSLAPKGWNITFISEEEKPDYATLQSYIKSQQIVSIAHVRNNTHFVLLTGWDPDVANTFYVNDPAYSSTTYSYNDISDVILYQMSPKIGRAVQQECRDRSRMPSSA
eukprot:TRINITY_DN17900_c0_g1_i6.p1 TRINITY_DN17900_c0_g1~~TRINITY_DN17900_c0_g1_i6.p1  ORF type:complete len:140 (-),score=24.17 TRINITY_DN17900_c0_g1_i6:11-430(-)